MGLEWWGVTIGIGGDGFWWLSTKVREGNCRPCFVSNSFFLSCLWLITRRMIGALQWLGSEWCRYLFCILYFSSDLSDCNEAAVSFKLSFQKSKSLQIGMEMLVCAVHPIPGRSGSSESATLWIWWFKHPYEVMIMMILESFLGSTSSGQLNCPTTGERLALKWLS